MMFDKNAKHGFKILKPWTKYLKMFLFINTSNIDEKFDYEFDQNLQFHPIALPHKWKKNRKKNCTNFTCSTIRWKLLQKYTRVWFTSGGKNAWHNYGTHNISLWTFTKLDHQKQVPHLQGSCLH